MKSKKKMLRNKTVWYSIWNCKQMKQSPKCDAVYQPIRHSEK